MAGEPLTMTSDPSRSALAGYTLARVSLRTSTDLVSLSRRTRAAAEELGLATDDLRRLSAATYEAARLVFQYDDVTSEIWLCDDPSLQIVFRLPMGEPRRAGVRQKLAPALALLEPLVDRLQIDETADGICVSLRALLPPLAAPAETSVGASVFPAPGDIAPETLQERFVALQQDYRDLQAELEETNRGVIAIYSELEKQAERLREAEDRLRRRADDLAAANRAKEDFLATLSHELRTPLNAMLGWTRLLRLGKLQPDATARALETIERNARAQEQLIADILDMSRIVTGKLRLELTPCDVRPVIDAALDAVRPAADAKGVQLDSNIMWSGSVLGDTDRLQQVLWNLLVNGIKFTPAGGTVSVGLSCMDETATITVTDSGEGIPEDLLPFIFDRFRQGDSSVTRPHGGLGLGLSIVRHIVELHGGKVQAWSAGAGQGATFAVYLPVHSARERASASA